MFRDQGGDLSADASGEVGLVDDDDAVSAHDRCEDGLLVQGLKRTQIDDLGLHALFGRQFVCGLLRSVHHGSVGDDRDITAGAGDMGPAERDEELLAGIDFILDSAIEVLVLEKEDRIVIAHRTLE